MKKSYKIWYVVKWCNAFWPTYACPLRARQCLGVGKKEKNTRGFHRKCLDSTDSFEKITALWIYRAGRPAVMHRWAKRCYTFRNSIPLNAYVGQKLLYFWIFHYPHRKCLWKLWICRLKSFQILLRNLLIINYMIYLYT